MEKSGNRLAEEIFKVVPSIMQTIRQEMRGNVTGMTIPQFRILAKLHEGPTNHRDLADWIGVSLPAISRMVNILEDRQLVHRDRQRQDRRHVHLTITPHGLNFFNVCKTKGQKSLAKRLQKLSLEKKERLFRSLKFLETAIYRQEDEYEKNFRIRSSFGSSGLRPRTNQ